MKRLRIVAVLLIAGALLTCTVWAQTETTITIAPSTIVLAAPVQWVTVQTDLPYGTVDRATVQLDGIQMAWSKANACGEFVAKFKFADVAALLASEHGPVTLTLAGSLNSGDTFIGFDEVHVK